MPTQLATLGMQAAGSALGGIMGIGFGGLQNSQQYEQQKKLNRLNREMIDYQKMKELEMWKATNYQAQMEELKKAGLNPGLLYGMSGGGGTTTGSSGGGNSAATPQQGGIMGMQLGTQAALLAAQTENIKADTEKKKVETTKTAGIDTEQVKTGITEAQTRITTMLLNNEYLNRTLNDRIDLVNTEAGRAITELDRADLGKQLDRQTIVQKTEIIKAEAIGAILQNALISSQTNKNEQEIAESKQRIEQSKSQIGKWAEEIMQGWEGLDNQAKTIKLDGLMKRIQASQPQGIPAGSTIHFSPKVEEIKEAIDKIINLK